MLSPAAVSPETAPGPRRGVAPRILLGHVQVTAPFLFGSHRAAALAQKEAPHLGLLIGMEAALTAGAAAESAAPLTAEPVLTHADYFRLCLAAHHATVATYVPTDVDNQIRFKLWDPTLPLDEVRAMAAVVVDSLDWDCRFVSARWIPSPVDDGILTGHTGEWLSTAVAAYGALRKRDPDGAAQVAALVDEQMRRHARIFAAYKKAGDEAEAKKTLNLLQSRYPEYYQRSARTP
jgi:hypothetical protein